MKKTTIVLACLLSGFAASNELPQAEDRKIEIEQIKLWESNLEKSEAMNAQDKIDCLSLGLRNMGYRKTLSNHGAEVERMYQLIQATLLAIPGHAEYYRDDINKARAKFEEALKGGDETLIGETRQYLAGKLLFDFPTLDHLPSVETVRVLGEFLSDERGYVKMPEHPTLEDLTTDVSGSPVFRRAAASLGKLPIVNKPIPASTQFRTPDDVRPWKQWYEQIKAGNRTFRFEGDATEYDLNGPASKDTLVRIERDRMRDAERLAGRRKASPDTGFVSQALNLSKPSSIAGLLAAAGLCAAALWYFLTGERVA